MAVTDPGATYDAVSDRVYAALDALRTPPRRPALPRRRHASPTPTCSSTCSSCASTLVAVPLGRLTRKRLVDHPHLWAYARDLYQRPAFRETTDFDHIVRGTFGTGAGIRTNRIVPATAPTPTGTRRTVATPWADPSGPGAGAWRS